jgi:hypothetical protein
MDEVTPTYFAMPVEQRSSAILLGLHQAHVDFLVVGPMAGILTGVPSDDAQLDIVHRRTPENVARLLSWLRDHDAYDRLGLPHRRLPTEGALLDNDDVCLQTDLGKLNVRRASWNGGYEGMLIDMVMVDRNRIEDLIAANGHSALVEDRAVFPVLIVAWDQLQKGKGA